MLCGLAGNDSIAGMGGNDRLLGGPGDDVLDGGPGSDTLIGGPGRDFMTGGAGSDRIDARDGVWDRVDCSREVDVAWVDRIDSVSNCETVHRT